MKQIIFLFFMLFIIPYGFTQTKYLTGSDSIATVHGGTFFKTLRCNLSDSSDASKDTVVFETYSRPFNKWTGARMLNLIDGSYIDYDSVVVLEDGAFRKLELTEPYSDGFRVKRRNRTATKRMGVEIYQRERDY